MKNLSDLVLQLHNSAYTAAVKAVNRFATVHNDVIGFYIVEYEQNGSDRAKYGEQLIKRLAKKVNKQGINETMLYSCRRFYVMYPQILPYLNGQKKCYAVAPIGYFPDAVGQIHNFCRKPDYLCLLTWFHYQTRIHCRIFC